MLRYAPYLMTVLLLFSCAAARAQDPSLASPLAVQYGPPKQIAEHVDERIYESSGLARSYANPGSFWTHNDSGDVPRTLLIDRDGRLLGMAFFDNADAIDWEDMASFEREGHGYLLIGDIGDNRAAREQCTIYLVPEPNITPGPEAAVVRIQPSVTIPFVYEDGPRDCESIAVDQTSGTIYLVSKSRKKKCAVYELPWPTEEAGTLLTARQIATLGIAKTTAMDISADGTRAIVLTYDDAYEFTRGEGETWAQAFSREGRTINMPERKQGEAICYGTDDRTLYLTSEGEGRPFWEVPPVSDSRSSK